MVKAKTFPKDRPQICALVADSGPCNWATLRGKFRDNDQAGLDDLVNDFIDEAEDQLVGVYDLAGRLAPSSRAYR